MNHTRTPSAAAPTAPTHTDSSGVSAYRRIRLRYITGLSIIACLTILGQSLLHYMIADQRGAADVVNIAGRQRMLSQKIAKAALAEDYNELRKALDLWHQSHLALTQGDESMGIPDRMPEDIRQRYQRMEPDFQRMLAAAQSILITQNTDHSEHLREILDSEQDFLVQMNEIVFAYAEYNENNVALIDRIELALGIATLVILVLEVLFIFEPLVRRLKASWNKLEDSELRFRLAVQGSSDAIFDWDLVNERLYLAPRFAELVGVRASDLTDSPKELLGRISSQHLPAFTKEVAEVVADPNRRLDMEIQVQHSDGTMHWMFCRAAEYRDESGAATRLVGSLADITQLKQQQQRLQELAERDPLTGLANRNFFRDQLELRIARQTERDQPYAVLFFDFDRFKMVNDSLGHNIGDGLLKSFAKRIVAELPDSALVARFGGDEFAVLLSCDSPYEILERGRALITELAQPHQVAQHQIVSTASIGLVLCNPRYDTAEPMLRDADIAMYEAKRTGRSKLVVFDTAMHETLAEQQRLERELARPDITEQLRMEYQPIVSLEEGTVIGFESLARWRNPVEGEIRPDRFIAIAEECGVIDTIGQWVLTTASDQLAQWDKQHPDRGLYITVNVSRKQLLSPAFMEQLADLKSRRPTLVPRIVLEITETAVVDERVDVSAILADIRALGYPIAMDDFGTGYSSLSCLHNYPISYLKIDRTFVMNLEERREFTAVFAAIVSLANALDLKVVAEGIESQAQLAQLQAMGCSFGQGYFFAKPLLAGQADELLDGERPMGPQGLGKDDADEGESGGFATGRAA